MSIPDPIGESFIDCGPWSQWRPGRVESHPRMVKLPDICSFNNSRKKNPVPQGRCCPARFRSPTCIRCRLSGQPDRLIADWPGSYSQRAIDVAPHANVEVSLHPEQITIDPRILNMCLNPQLQQSGDGIVNPPCRYRSETP